MPPVVFIFLDGVGLGPADESNPMWLAVMPALHRLIGGPLVAGARKDRPDLVLRNLDPLLGVEGVPQSATGQTALFTGINVVKQLGYHLPAYPNGSLTKTLHEHSILRRAKDEGHRVTFANAYSSLYFKLVKQEKRRMSATTQAVLGAHIPFRWISDLERGEAVYWDITNEQLNERFDLEVPTVSPERAGLNLARISVGHELVLFESFLLDFIGHRKQKGEALEALNRIDRFLGSVWDHVAPETTVLLCSDHGNVEDLRTRRHTVNPVPLLATGPGAHYFRGTEYITDVAGPLLRLLNGDPEPAHERPRHTGEDARNSVP